MAELVLSGVRKRYGDHEVVRGVDLQVDDGAVVCLLGGSGCGKTTVLRMIAGLEVPSGGAIRIDGQPVDDLPPEGRRIGMVFQSYALWPHLDVLRNVTFPLEMAKIPEPEARARRILDTVRLTGLERRHPHQLSGGQQQRVALARALVAEPRLLLLDEPLSNLDAELRAEVRDEIRELVKRLGLTAILVTHDHEEAFAVADRIALMDRGRIAQYGPPVDLYQRPETEAVARFLGLEVLCGQRAGDAVEIGGAKIAIHPTREAPEAGPCELGFRIEDARLAEDGIPGIVAARTWLGSTVRCRVRIGERLVRVTGDAPVGASVHVRIARGFALGAST